MKQCSMRSNYAVALSSYVFHIVKLQSNIVPFSRFIYFPGSSVYIFLISPTTSLTQQPIRSLGCVNIQFQTMAEGFSSHKRVQVLHSMFVSITNSNIYKMQIHFEPHERVNIFQVSFFFSECNLVFEVTDVNAERNFSQCVNCSSSTFKVQMKQYTAYDQYPFLYSKPVQVTCGNAHTASQLSHRQSLFVQ